VLDMSLLSRNVVLSTNDACNLLCLLIREFFAVSTMLMLK
jgi:hypothetical protein